MKFYVNVIVINMLSTLFFRRKLQSHGGYYFVSIPPSVARFLDCKDVDIVMENGTITINPVRENVNEES